MTKKKSNGFMFFADSRRNAYETEAGGALGARKHCRLVERAASDWTRMRPEEQTRWKNESRRKQEQPTTDLRHNSKQKTRGMSQLERELLGRSREYGVSRTEARQSLTHKLIWREKETTEQIRVKRWCLIVCSEEANDGIPEEVWAIAFEGETVKGELGLVTRRQERTKTVGDRVHDVQITEWNSSQINDVNTVCMALAKFVSSCWGNIILVPFSQLDRITEFFLWMKHTRDQHYSRDTTSIRLDRLICLEDVIHVFRDLNSSTIDEDDDIQWTLLCGEQPIDARQFGNVAFDYISCSLKSACVSQREGDERLREGKEMRGMINPFEREMDEMNGKYEEEEENRNEEDHTEAVFQWLEYKCPEDAEYETMEPLDQWTQHEQGCLGEQSDSLTMDNFKE